MFPREGDKGMYIKNRYNQTRQMEKIKWEQVSGMESK